MVGFVERMFMKKFAHEYAESVSKEDWSKRAEDTKALYVARVKNNFERLFKKHLRKYKNDPHLEQKSVDKIFDFINTFTEDKSLEECECYLKSLTKNKMVKLIMDMT
jgi:hypothetical protein